MKEKDGTGLNAALREIKRLRVQCLNLFEKVTTLEKQLNIETTRRLFIMIKYGVGRKQIEELIKLGVCSNEESAREIVAKGEAEDLIKTAQEQKKESDVCKTLQKIKKPNAY